MNIKIIQINATCGAGSTGKICVAISKSLTVQNIENYILYSAGVSNYALGIRYSNKNYIKLQALKSRLLGNYGFNSHLATKKLLKEIDRIQPDIVHLHNIHGHDCDLAMLFQYFRAHENVKIYWTFHDCWAFTGYCPHFTLVQCNQWEDGCGNCPQWKQYSWIADKSAMVFNRKKALFENINLTIITPSQWLETLVKKSFLGNYPIKTINNGIDLNIFKPTENNFRERYDIKSKYVILGVAFGWGKRKGLDVFVKLSEMLDNSYQIVLVGMDARTEKTLPKNIISIRKTENQQELAQIYSAATVFVNPTREENYPTVNMESIACGTPVITFRTGGSPEIIQDGCGFVVNVDDIAQMKKQIQICCESAPEFQKKCLVHAKSFDETTKYDEYIKEYNKQ